jgi:hypothetical protein
MDHALIVVSSSYADTIKDDMNQVVFDQITNAVKVEMVKSTIDQIATSVKSTIDQIATSIKETTNNAISDMVTFGSNANAVQVNVNLKNIVWGRISDTVNAEFAAEIQENQFLLWANCKNQCTTFWKSIREVPSAYEHFKIYKYGAKTELTIGSFVGFDVDGSIKIKGGSGKKFTEPGDSGALILIQEPGIGLLPFGVHYSTDEVSGDSLAIPMWTILKHFYTKNNLTGDMNVQFISPSLTPFTFLPTDFQD